MNFTWTETISMTEARAYAASAQFGDTGLWWITGGENDNGVTESTEIYDGATEQFTPFVDLPVPMYGHNLVNINNTHMVALGGFFESNQAFMFDSKY